MPFKTLIPRAAANVLFKRVGHKTIRYLKRVTYKKSKDLTRQIYDDICADYVLGPPFTLHAAVPGLLAAAWSIVRETFIVDQKAGRLLKEEIAGGVALSNECPFCVAVHFDMSGGKAKVEETRISEWSRKTYSPHSDRIKKPPFSKSEAPEITGTAVSSHYVNRMVSIFVDEYPLALPQVLNRMKPLISSFFKLTASGNMVNSNARPGKSLNRLNDSSGQSLFPWADTNPDIARAFSEFDAVIDSEGQTHIDEKLRQRLKAFISRWNGEKLEMGNMWLENELKGLNEETKACGRFLFLAAMQPYKIADHHIEELRKRGMRDDALLIHAAWASWLASKRIGSWL